ncbi:uncharacterized protein [Cicer arietinum]|uniref:uncharacterized protein n=1 Tax=Cicer arietinum TaxID=3827 RepID=UPI003CC58563
MCGLHNHELVDTFENNAFVGCLKEEYKMHVDELIKYHVASRHMLSYLRYRDEENVTNISQIYKQRNTYRKNLKGPRTYMQYLLKLFEAEKTGWKYKSSHPDSLTIGNSNDPLKTISTLKETSLFGLLSLIEPSSIDEALRDERWVLDMQEELNEFKRNDV